MTGGNMRKTRQIILIAIVLLTALMPLFAGGDGEKTKTQKVTIWHCAQGSNADVFDKIIKSFNEGEGKEKGIEVEAIYQGKANDVLTSVNAASGTDSLPDIAMMDATAAIDMNHSKYLVTIDRLGIDTSDILPCAISSYTSENGLLALPFNASALLFYYNREIFLGAGLNEPRTLDDLIEIAKILGSKGYTAFAGVPATYELTYFIGAQNGLSYMVNNKNGHEGAPTEVLFGKDGTYKAFLEKWKELYDTGYYNPISSGVTAEFTSGRCASMLASSSNLASLMLAVQDEFEVGVAPVPMVNEDATGGAVISGGALFAFSDSDAVKTVLEYLVSPNVQIRWSEGTGYVSVNLKAYDITEYKAIMWKCSPIKTASDSLIHSNPDLVNVWLPSAYSIYYAFQANIADVLNGKDIDTAVDEMVATVQSALDTYAAQNP